VPFELQIALRYLLARRKQAFISVISFISTLGVAVGVMAVIIALAIMTGLQGELRDRILGSSPHIYVLSREGIANYEAEIARLRQLPHIAGAAPAILGRATNPSRSRASIRISSPPSPTSRARCGRGASTRSNRAATPTFRASSSARTWPRRWASRSAIR
jgi:hypothetical protein